MGETGAECVGRREGGKEPGRREDSLLRPGSVAETMPVSLSSPARMCRVNLRGEGEMVLWGV